MRTEIIYEDNDILVVYKPAGLATQTAKLGQADVVSELKNYLASAKSSAKNAPVPGGQKVAAPSPREVYLGVIHRLDQPVEGLLVFAKHKKAAADLTVQLQRQGDGGSLHKHYYAVVCGKPADKQGRLVDYMYKNRDNVAVIVEKAEHAGSSHRADSGSQTTPAGPAEAQAKEAVLEYRIMKTVEKGDIFAEGKANDVSANQSEAGNTGTLALADINILTGRFHQIRAQMAHGGMPLLGDVKYGSPEAKELAKALGVQTVALCAYSLDFSHPATKKMLHFQEVPRGRAFHFFSKE